MFWSKKPVEVSESSSIIDPPPTKVSEIVAPAAVSGYNPGLVNGGVGIVNPTEYFDRYGFPGVVHDLGVRGEYVSYFDRRNRNPWWIIEHITAQSLSGSKGNRGQSVFTEDTAVPELYRARLKDYFRSGYDRGHMAPAADAKYSQEAMNETFYLSNMCPQVGEGFNRDYWAHFEFFVRGLTNTFQSVRVVSGPLYLPKKCPDGKWRVSYEMIGNPPNVAVPTHFYKIIVGENPIGSRHPPSSVAVGAFVLPNEPISNSVPLKSFYVPIEMIERSAGLEFLPKLAKNNRRDLCREVACEITVREFDKAVKSLPAPAKPLPGPKL